VPAQRAKKEASGPTAILEKLKHDKVRWVQLFYTDVFGGFNQVDVPAFTLDEDSFESGVPKLDGSSVRGFREIYESDMNLLPDPSTLATIPWNPEAGGTVRFICDVRIGGSKESYAHDPRWVARKTEQVLAAAGYDCSYWGPEVEFFVFDSIELIPSPAGVRDAWGGAGYLVDHSESPWHGGPVTGTVRFKEGYHRTPPHDSLLPLRAEMCNILADDFHLTLDAHHHEVATASQSEINLRFDSSCRWPTTSRTFATSSGTWPHGTGRSVASCRNRSTGTTGSACTPTSRSGRRGKPPSLTPTTRTPR